MTVAWNVGWNIRNGLVLVSAPFSAWNAVEFIGKIDLSTAIIDCFRVSLFTRLWFVANNSNTQPLGVLEYIYHSYVQLQWIRGKKNN